MIKVNREIGVMVVYDSKQSISFFRPLYGTENEMTDEEIIKRISYRIKKWKQ
jgi:hypothetical protein